METRKIQWFGGPKDGDWVELPEDAAFLVIAVSNTSFKPTEESSAEAPFDKWRVPIKVRAINENENRLVLDYYQKVKE